MDKKITLLGVIIMALVITSISFSDIYFMFSVRYYESWKNQLIFDNVI